MHNGHMFALLDGVGKRLRAEIEKVPVRGGVAKALQLIPPEGIRLTDLADVARMTKQSIGEFVTIMENDGLVTFSQLAEDRRVKIVSRTGKGDEVSATIDYSVAVVENSWREEVGSERFEIMKEVLREICDGG